MLLKPGHIGSRSPGFRLQTLYVCRFIVISPQLYGLSEWLYKPLLGIHCCQTLSLGAGRPGSAASAPVTDLWSIDPPPPPPGDRWLEYRPEQRAVSGVTSRLANVTSLVSSNCESVKVRRPRADVDGSGLSDGFVCFPAFKFAATREIDR